MLADLVLRALTSRPTSELAGLNRCLIGTRLSALEYERQLREGSRNPYIAINVISLHYVSWPSMRTNEKVILVYTCIVSNMLTTRRSLLQ